MASSNFNRDGEEFTCQFANSEGVARKTFKITLLKSGLDAGLFTTIIIAIAIIVMLLSFLLKEIFQMKVFSSY